MNPFTWLYNQVFSQACLPADSQFVEQVDSVVNFHLQQQKIAGLTLALIQNGEVVLMKGYGWANIQDQVPADVQTMYRIASLSKTITATAVLHAANRGLIDLTADIRTYVPEYPEKPQGSITIEQLLACEGGIQQYDQISPFNQEALETYIRQHTTEYDPIAAINIFKDQELMAAPGTTFNYSTFSFNLLAAALERATGQPFEEYIEQMLKGPMNLPYLQPEYSGLQPYPQQAAWYYSDGKQTLPDKHYGPDYVDVSWKLGGGGYVGTVVDVAGYARALMNGSLLPSATLKQMFTSRKIQGQKTHYGLGFFLQSFLGETVATQFGHQAGARSLLYLVPAKKNGIVILSNTYGTDLMPLAKELYKKLEKTPNSFPLCENPFPFQLETPVLRSELLAYKNQNIYLSWLPVSYADAYEIAYAANPTFEPQQTVSFRQNNSAVIPFTGDGNLVYVKIKAVNPYLYQGTESAWSELVTLQMDSEPSKALLPVNLLFDQMLNMDAVQPYTLVDGITLSRGGNRQILQLRSGARSQAVEGGLTLDLMPIDGVGEAFLDWTFLFPDSLQGRLPFRVDYVSHVADSSLPVIACWVRGQDSEPWRFVSTLPYGSKVGEKLQAEFDLSEVLIRSEGGGSLSGQLRFYLRTDTPNPGGLPKPMLTLLQAVITEEWITNSE